MKHTGENYGFVMFGIVFATFGAPAISGLVSSKGYEMNVVFGIGAVFAVIAFCLLYTSQHGENAYPSFNGFD